jgi:hypothetical protein
LNVLEQNNAKMGSCHMQWVAVELQQLLLKEPKT